MGVYENINGSQISIASNLRFRNIPIEGFVTEEELVQGLATKNDVFQYETMPTASSSLEGKVVQYVGATTSSFTKGCFYRCDLVDNNYVWVVISDLPTGGQTGQVLIKSSDADYEAEWKTIDGVERKKVYTPVDVTLITGSYVSLWTGNIAASVNAAYFEIPVTSGEKYLVMGNYSDSIALYAFYDSNGNFKRAYPSAPTSATTESVEITIPDGVTKMRCSGWVMNDYALKLYAVSEKNAVKNIHDALYGKKWVACGDSFTAGEYTGYVDAEGNSGQKSDAFDPITCKYKAYPYFIANKTGVDPHVLARSGSDLTNISGATEPFSNENSAINYTQIPLDADYITIAYGLNETGLTAEQIGTKADTTNETLWGAYSVILTSILTANPKVKIGIIITDGWLTQTYHDALIEIAKYWGIPYLDLKNGVEVPMMTGGRLDECSETAKTLRNSAFRVSSTNLHPNVEGHKYRATVIENFLRSL